MNSVGLRYLLQRATGLPTNIQVVFLQGEILVHQVSRCLHRGNHPGQQATQWISKLAKKGKEIQITLPSLMSGAQHNDFLLPILFLATFVTGISPAFLNAYFPLMPTPQSASTFSVIEWILGVTIGILMSQRLNPPFFRDGSIQL